jgi:hypothetical protein
MNADPAADPPTFDYDPGYPQTYERDFDNVYDRVTVRDIADLRRRCGRRAAGADPASAHIAHYNTHRPHRTLDQQPPAGRTPPPSGATVRPLRRDCLGGLIHEYLQVA